MDRILHLFFVHVLGIFQFLVTGYLHVVGIVSVVQRSDNIDFGWPDMFDDVVDSICFGGADFCLSV